MMKQRSSVFMTLSIIMLLILTFSIILMPKLTNADEKCLKNAWEVFNVKDYKKSIKYADECIDSFGKKAARIQKELEEDNIPDPPTGAVEDAEKNKIFKRGILNDVASAYWIKGRAAEYLYKTTKNNDYKKMATEAYTIVCKDYKYGRTWDPKGWFWSPCEDASDRLPLK